MRPLYHPESGCLLTVHRELGPRAGSDVQEPEVDRRAASFESTNDEDEEAVDRRRGRDVIEADVERGCK